MVEDKLTHAERVRLEAFCMSINATNIVGLDAATKEEAMPAILKRAEELEKWLRSAQEDA